MVATLAIGINRQTDEAGAVWIVLNTLHLGRDIALGIFKINIAEAPLVATALVPDSNPAGIVATHPALAPLKERFVRCGTGKERSIIESNSVAARGRGWSILFHNSKLHQ